MDLFQIFILALYITQAFTKSRSRKYKEQESDEGSIENLLYIKDCRRNEKNGAEITTSTTTTQPPPPPPPSPGPVKLSMPVQKQPECLFPKMCCSMTCGNDCGNSHRTFSGGHSELFSNMQRSHGNFDLPDMEPVQPKIKRVRKKKMKFRPNDLQASLPKRRDFSGLTKERIKGVLAQDNDIRKILKDLVRVTMQKVNLQDIISTPPEKTTDNVNMRRSMPSSMYNPDDYEEY